MGVPLVGGLPLGRVHPLLSCHGLGRLVAYSPRAGPNPNAERGGPATPGWGGGPAAAVGGAEVNDAPGPLQRQIAFWGFGGSFWTFSQVEWQKKFFQKFLLREKNRAPSRGTRNGSRRAHVVCDRVTCARRVRSVPRPERTPARTRNGSRAIEWPDCTRGREKQRSRS